MVQEGDILLYFRDGGISDPLIKVGEILEDGEQSREYYHAAVAANSQLKIEVNGFEPVCVTNIINDGSFDVFRPPIPLPNIRDGLFELRQLVGEKYDWWLIVDDILRFLTANLIHLPEQFIQNQERRRKICSTLVAFYLSVAGFGTFRKWPKPSPEDIYMQVKDYQIKQIP